MIKLLVIIYCCFLYAGCLKEEYEHIELMVDSVSTHTIAKKDIVLLRFETGKITVTDMSKKEVFKVNITNEQFSDEVSCGFWGHSDKQYIFCDIGENIPSGTFNLDFVNLPEFFYDNRYIKLKQSYSLSFTKQDKYAVNLYLAEPQDFDVKEDKDTYDIKIKIISYNKELIMLNFILFIDCSQENDELTCHIKKNDLEKIMTINEGSLEISCQDQKFDLVPYIKVTYNNLEKIDVYVGITKLLVNAVEHDTLIAYETNVTQISNVYTELENENILAIQDEAGGIENLNCGFRKYDGNPLLIVCWGSSKSEYWLKEITEEKRIENLNIKYNFRIQPTTNTQKIFYKSSSGSFITWIYPQKLDFINSDSQTFELGAENADDIVGLTFNENEKDLSCELLSRKIKKCTVSKSHFKGKQSGYYFLKHNNHLEGKSSNYEFLPLKVEINGANIISALSLYYLLLLIIL